MKPVILPPGNNALVAIPRLLQDVPQEILGHYLVNVCRKYKIKTMVSLVREFEKPHSNLLKELDSLDIERLAYAIITYDALSSVHCLIYENYHFSKN
jgi:hypothetical protein